MLSFKWIKSFRRGNHIRICSISQRFYSNKKNLKKHQKTKYSLVLLKKDFQFKIADNPVALNIIFVEVYKLRLEEWLEKYVNYNL